MPFTLEKLSEKVFKIVQDDPFGQYPFLYVIKGTARVVVIDTGCPVSGGQTYKEFLDKEINSAGLPYVVICTHIHFDHVGGNCEFCKGRDIHDARHIGEIYMGAGHKTFTQNHDLNSLASVHGTSVPDFKIDKWLQDGEKVYLDPENPTENESLEVIYTPGHTPDSISLLFSSENRIFSGDLLYPFTVIHLDSLGSNVDEYTDSIQKLIKVTGCGGSVLSATCNLFLESLGLTQDAIARQFCVATLLTLCGDDVEQAVNMYLTNLDEIGSICPPQQGGGAAEGKYVLSCGHVEANLAPSALEQVLSLVAQARGGSIVPASVDEGYGEYTDGTYSIMMPMPHH